MRWASNVLLHFCWIKRGNADALDRVFPHFDPAGVPWGIIPLDAILSLLLVWSKYLGCSIEEELLQIPDKTYVGSQFSLHVDSIVITQRLLGTGRVLIILRDCHSHLREMAYRWCSAICEKYPDLEGREELLFLSLKVGFRDLDVRYHWTDTGEISDFLQAWATNDYLQMPYELIYMWPAHLVQLPPTVLFPRGCGDLSYAPSSASVSYRLNRSEWRNSLRCWTAWALALTIWIPRMSGCCSCCSMSSDTLRVGSPYPTHTGNWWWNSRSTSHGSRVTSSTTNCNRSCPSSREGGGWDRLECWSGFVWLLLCPNIDTIPEDLKRVTLSLFRRQPDAAERFEKWMRGSNVDHDCLECLRWICDEAVSQSHTA